MDRRERGANSPYDATLSALQAFMAGVWTAMPGFASRDLAPGAQTIEVQLAVRARVQRPDGTFEMQDLPVLVDVPVHFPHGGGCSLTFPVKAGDECLVVFASRCIDGWWSLSGVQNPPDLRKHDLSDGFALFGFRSTPRVITAISATRAQLRSDDGAAFVEIDPTTHLVRARTSGPVTVDADGAVLIKSGVSITLQAPAILSQAAASFGVQAPAISMQGNMTWAGVGGGSGTVAAGAMTVTYTGGALNYVGTTITSDGKNISGSHTHGGVASGGANTAAPNP